MEGKQGGAEEENPHALNMNLMRKALCHRWRLHPDWAECSSLAGKLASEVLGIWIMKMRAKSSASSYRNPDCLRLSEHQKRHWQRDIVIFKSKLTPGAPASSVTARHRATAWMENTAHGFDWTAAGIIRHFSSNSRDIICHFSFHSNRANECSLAHIQSWTSLQLLIFEVEIIRNGFVSLVILSYFFFSLFLSLNGSALREKKPSWMHQRILMWTSKKLSQIRGSDRREGEVWNCGKLDCFVYFQSSPLSLVGISECDLNLFIIFEGISPMGPFE